ncbi:hypothetical protein [uncultured Bacteroides sp.]|jgi:hypothetical protein|uniref:hypothetical protein n=1 Tax=uncultured Bacteroides sp. TaxID=162156 RepID=UPI002060F55D|nr:hypothetical protein [uncultured Bacteroides sp.]DAR50013.1 MAG TPA: holin [Caudoviricetes sp.]
MQIEDSNIGNVLIQGGTTAFFSVYMTQAYLDMLPWIVAAVPLIVGDLYFGIKKVRCKYVSSKGHSEKPSFTKAIGMTIDKAFSYVCWILIATTLGLAFETSAIKYVIMGVVYLKELISCFRNYFNSKGYDVNEAEMFKLMWRLAIRKGEETTEELNKLIIKKEEKDEN